MNQHPNQHKEHSAEVHIVSYREHASTFLALILLTVMTVTVSVFGADLYTLTVLTALAIASAKAVVVGLYFMHLKYDPKIYKAMMAVVLILFTVFLILTLIDYLIRP
ncbi:MAG TPA: cytochrome C oxidase subunit IV family protein [Bacteroidales bacterium]|nr:cytochrome C oxidase subunit IV family protein [Bacteroidales bacterium]HPM93694.1 cytochrome C oxidase subunit IV family protein [Bacteroidales bacterium]